MNSNAYSDRDFVNLQTLGNYIAIALDNANAYRQLDIQNQKITGSINYAQTIQRAILPVTYYLFDSFVLYRPKDVVSGDFYWFVTVSSRGQNFAAVVDCTGHGVPGAFMSMIGYSLLNELVLQRGIYEPAEILEQLDKGVKRRLHQETTENDDGMDVALVRITTLENQQTELTFAGAKRRLIYYENGKLETLNGTSRSVGGGKRRVKRPFDQHTFEVPKGTILYLTSDGYIDQPNNRRKRFGSKRLFQVLKENGHLSMLQQQLKLERTFEEFSLGQEQRDDVTIMGLKV